MFRLYPAWSRRNALTKFVDLPSSSAIRQTGQQLASWAIIWPFSNVVKRGFRGMLWSGKNFSHELCVHNTLLSYLWYCLVKFRGNSVSSFHGAGVLHQSVPIVFAGQFACFSWYLPNRSRFANSVSKYELPVPITPPTAMLITCTSAWLYGHRCTRGKNGDIAERGALLAMCTIVKRTIKETPPL